jgi:hypothetical protein
MTDTRGKARVDDRCAIIGIMPVLRWTLGRRAAGIRVEEEPS